MSNPIFPKQHDPFLFLSDEAIERAGGFEKILDEAIDLWNKRADALPNKFPRTNKETGMDWELIFMDGETSRKNREEWEEKQKK